MRQRITQKYAEQLRSITNEAKEKKGVSMLILIRDGEENLTAITGNELDIASMIAIAIESDEEIENLIRISIEGIDFMRRMKDGK